ncbi:MAG: peptide deformylase [Gammaproteobacteria bacterium]|nr:peptide deformylase [Gammaproteobacteria bacterium]
MALLEILHFPDPRLRKIARPVDKVGDQVRQTVKDMLETMYDAPGIGLAATQVNIQQQIIVMDVSEAKDAPLCLINPEIISQEGDEEMQEGCLSVPGIFENVHRAARIIVKALDQNGNSISQQAEGLLAVCIQHEIDHLEGKLFVDYLSSLKRERVKKKLLKQQRQEQVPHGSASQQASVI